LSLDDASSMPAAWTRSMNSGQTAKTYAKIKNKNFGQTTTDF
jgi:hypothetical protein